MSDLSDLKIITLGLSRVGKTSILNRYFQNKFDETFLTTIGIEYSTQYFKFDDEKVRINYIDTAGQEIFRSISSNYLKKADGVILVFDITERDSFNLINDWIEDLNKNNNINNIGKILLGNKIDLEDIRKIKIEEGKNLASSINCQYMEVSAKTGQNVKEALELIAKDTYQKYKSFRRKSTLSSYSLEKPIKKAKSKKRNKVSNSKECCLE